MTVFEARPLLLKQEKRAKRRSGVLTTGETSFCATRSLARRRGPPVIVSPPQRDGRLVAADGHPLCREAAGHRHGDVAPGLRAG
jgi:hypothetical protein